MNVQNRSHASDPKVPDQRPFGVFLVVFVFALASLSTVLSYAHSTYHGLCACLWLLGDALATLLNCTDKGNGHDTSTHLQLAPLLEACCLFP